ncbi:hypothetical protein SCHPADRAFT_258016 [Schizopora paradoxa]|uniref:Uncharacterized protein n=1 Tax=Schizopora paradoxa TaxID=27342 RepID=A0A0H2RU34_9AGAM|nr:hypothetical protein SCHPADRAFT_258016 [Schizopora paradoxa]
MSFSGRFTMSGMSGKTNSPDPAALSSPAVNPSTIATQSNGVFGTSTLSASRASSTASLASTSALKTSPAVNSSTSTTSLLSSSSSSSTVTPSSAPIPANASSSGAKRKIAREVKDAVRGGALVLGAIMFSGGTLL